MRKKILQLVQYLVFSVSTFVACNSMGSSHSIVQNQIKVFNLRNSILGISKNNSSKFDLYYSKGNVEFRIFENKNEQFKFLRYNYGRKSFVIGQMRKLNSKFKVTSIFKFKNGLRYYSKLLCESENSFSKLNSLQAEITELVSKIESKKIDQVFNDSCSNIKPVENRQIIFSRLVKSVKESNDNLRKCLVDNDDVKAELDNDEFRRLMITYYVNLQKFAQDFSSDNPIVQFDCNENVSSAAKIELGGAGAPHKISLSKDFWGQNLSSIKSRTLQSEFTNFLFHELDHIYLQIPSVADANVCEHKYRDLIQTNCGNLAGFNSGKGLPRCTLKTNSAETLAPRVEIMQAIAVAYKKEDGAQAVEPNASPVTASGDRKKSLAALAADEGIAASVDVRGSSTVASTNAEPIQSQLSPSAATTVVRDAESIFTAAETGNRDVQQAAARLFEEQSGAGQQGLAERIASNLDRTVTNFTNIVGRLEALGGPAVAATVQAVPSGSGAGAGLTGVPSPNWTPQDALNAYISGAPPALQAASGLSLAAGGGGSESVVTDSSGAPILTISGKLLTFGAGNGVSASIKVTSSGGIASGANGSAVQKIARAGGNPGDATLPAPSQSNAYQIIGNGEPSAADTRELLLLTGGNKFSGTTYKEIRASYSKKKFVDDLDDRGIAIQIVDGSKKIITTLGAKIDSITLSRQPSSIDSGVVVRKKSRPVRVFIDNGESLELAPAPK